MRINCILTKMCMYTCNMYISCSSKTDNDFIYVSAVDL